MPASVDKVTVERSLDASIRDVAAYGLMLGLGENYLSACAVHLGASSLVIGVLASAPLFLGACFQPLAANLVDATGRRRRLYLFGAVLQALMWIPIVAAIFLPKPLDLWTLILGVILYFAGVHFASPPWNSTMGDLVPPEIRGRYFGRRNAAMIVCTWLATIVAGIGLHLYAEEGLASWGFGVIFTAAFAARIVSVRYLARMAEPPYHRTPDDAFTLVQFLRTLPRSNFTKFVFLVAAMNFAAHVSGVYMVVFFLRDLKMTYAEFMVSTSLIVVAQIPALYFWGSIGDKFGNRKVLIVTALGITVIPLCWMFARSLLWVCVLQVWAGLFWSGFNLSAANFLLDSVSPPKRARCTAYFNLIVGTAVLVSGLLGSSLVDHLPRRYDLLGLEVRFSMGFCALLLLSFLLRLLTSIGFLSKVREVREVPNVSTAEMMFRSTGLKSVAEAAVDLITNVRKGNGDGNPKSQTPSPNGEREATP